MVKPWTRNRSRVRSLVHESTFAQVLKDHVVPDGPLDFTASRAEVECGQMPATEEVDQVRGGANQDVSCLFHSALILRLLVPTGQPTLVFRDGFLNQDTASLYPTSTL